MGRKERVEDCKTFCKEKRQRLLIEGRTLETLEVCQRHCLAEKRQRLLTEGRKESLEDCKSFCLEKRRCSAMNYDNATKDCELRNCSLPVGPPNVRTLLFGTDKKSYWLEATGKWKPIQKHAEHT